jgi:hypothetical protein
MPQITLTKDWWRTRFIEPAVQSVPKNLRAQYKIDDIVRDCRSAFETVLDRNKVLVDNMVLYDQPYNKIETLYGLGLGDTWLIDSNNSLVLSDAEYIVDPVLSWANLFPQNLGALEHYVILPSVNFPTVFVNWVSQPVVDKEQVFNGLAAQWYSETGALSFIRQKAIHPAYQAIIGMGAQALPFIFRELMQNRGDWFWALEAITRVSKEQNPARGTTKYADARNAWLKWGHDRGFVT